QGGSPCEALGIGLRAARTAIRLGALQRGEDAVEEAIAMPREHCLNAAHVANIGAEADDHAAPFPARTRPRSIAAHTNSTVSSSPSNTASPTRKWPMLSSAISGKAAMVSPVP